MRRRPGIAVPESVRATALAADSAHWLDQLPVLISDLERDWSVRVGRPFRSNEAFVAEATTSGGTAAVLKLPVPRDGGMAHHEITALRLAGGIGCVRLLRDDVEREALLLERLGPSLYELGLAAERRHEILCEMASKVWRPAAGHGLPTGAEKGRALAEHINTAWERLDRPCSPEAVAHALTCAESRIAAHDDRRAVLVHGDLHRKNTLRADDGFKLIDPVGLLAEPEYDLGSIMRQDPEELVRTDPYDRARFLAARTGLDARAIWEWGVVQRVSTGLLGTALGLQPAASQMLWAADLIAREYGGRC